jgi:hypothetical protein
MSESNPYVLRPKATLITDPGGVRVADVHNNALDVNVKSVASLPLPLTPSAPTAAVVGTISILIVPANPSRTGLVLTNTSANFMSFGLGVPALFAEGITLNPFGSLWEMDATTFTTDDIYAIASADGSDVAIQEFS